LAARSNRSLLSRVYVRIQFGCSGSAARSQPDPWSSASWSGGHLPALWSAEYRPGFDELMIFYCARRGNFVDFQRPQIN
jgi:hypothetical protein